MSDAKGSDAADLWVAHASRVLVSASRRNELLFGALNRCDVSREVHECGTHSPTRETRALPRAAAFTLIELLVVMAIIIILAGLVLGISSYAFDKAARSRAESEIAAMSAALESYRADNGIYPYAAATNTLTPDQPDPTTTNYKNASLELYKALTGDADLNGVTDANQKNYFTFKPQMLGHTPTTSSDPAYIRDPWGNSYGYSTSKNPIANPSSYTTAIGNNPTFDLWSTAGPPPTPTPSPLQVRWIKNW